jgi:hypothetical protein
MSMDICLDVSRVSEPNLLTNPSEWCSKRIGQEHTRIRVEKIIGVGEPEIVPRAAPLRAERAFVATRHVLA